MQALRSMCSLLICLAVGLISCAGQSASSPTQVTVCSVRTHYRVYASSYVAIDAKVLADGMHGAWLVDDNCPGLNLAIGVSLPDAGADVAAFDKALWSSSSTGTVKPTISASFVGRLRRDRRTKKIHYDLLSVKNLRDSAGGQNLTSPN